MTSGEILCNPNMEDTVIASPTRSSSESSSFSLYTCRLCSRAFPTTRALGGHQTAHRKEKSERLLHIIRQAEIDELKYAADNDVVLSPVPISWVPPATDDQTFKVYNFMPMGNGTSSGSESEQGLESGLGVGSSGCSENQAYDVDQKKKQKKRKFKVYSFMPMGTGTSPGPGSGSESVQGLESGLGVESSGCSENKAYRVDQKKKHKKQKFMNLSGCSEINEASDEDQKKVSKSTKLSECSKNKASDADKTEKKSKSTNLSECSENKASVADQKKRKYTKLSECSEINKGSDADQKKRKSANLSRCSENKASDADQNKSEFRKLMPSPELTMATGAAPDVLVQVLSTDSDENGCTEYF